MYSQIKVNSSGKVGISGNPSGLNAITVNGTSHFTGKTTMMGTTTVNTMVYGYYGAYFSCTPGSNRFGIGYVPDGETTLKVGGGNEGGYSIKAYGDCYSTGSWISSDGRLKKDTASLNSLVEKVNLLQGKSYYYKTPEELKNVSMQGKVDRNKVDTIYKKGTASQPDTFITVEANPLPVFPQGRKFGFVAQEVEKIFPELVRYDSIDGLYAIDYIGFIPLLVETNKIQQAQIDDMQAQIDQLQIQVRELLARNPNLENQLKSGSRITNLEESGEKKPFLAQNIPNPFTESTEIAYFLPENVKTATMYVYDMNGKQLKSIHLYQKGQASIIIQGNELSAGMYMYSLITDGKVVDTKRMVLTD